MFAGDAPRAALSQMSLATVVHPSREDGGGDQNAAAATPRALDRKNLSIRERLRLWESENPTEAQSMLSDYAHTGEVSNSLTRPQNDSMHQVDVAPPLFDGDELSDLRSDSTNLRPGDLVEMSSQGSRRPLMAVCLGRFNGYEHYYTSGGQWFTGLGIQSLFVVHSFVQPAELEPIIKEIPLDEISLDTVNALRSVGHDPSRKAGAKLLKKMVDFTQEAEGIYQAHAGKLDASSAFIGDPVKHRYLTLHEIADRLLPYSIKREGKIPAVALYAVHRALLQDDIFFRPLKQAGHRNSYLFEISPLSEVRTIQKIQNLVRIYLETSNDKRKNVPNTFGGFVSTVQKAIDNSRKSRKPTTHGVIGPSGASINPLPEWSALDLEILHFIQLWSGYQKFPSGSSLQAIGSMILRAVDRYPDAKLEASAGWTLLQEVGYITPWDIQSRYKLRFPDIEVKRSGGFDRPYHGDMSNELTPDKFSSDRKTCSTMYAIDAETTTDIDDAISLERTLNPDQAWIHVHIADPASSIASDTAIANFAELVPETIYLQGHFSRMLPNDISVDRFSLAAGRPCMTFSALVDTKGSILEHKITPGTVGDIIYMTGEEVNEALGEMRVDPTATDQELSIGPKAVAVKANRTMTRPKDLTAEQKEELTLLSHFGKALHHGRLSKGAVPYFQARPSPKVSLDGVTLNESKDGFFGTTGDPSIHISFSKRAGTDIVEHTMRLACEVAARWCNERGIPVPYRTQPRAMQNAEMIRQFTQDNLMPLIESGQRPDDAMWRNLRGLLGGDELTTKPGPHFMMGVDMYTKATSPLRRFGDLIVHWQIQAALLEEKKLGKSLIGNEDDSFLPFRRDRLDRMLPMLRMRERQAKLLSNGSGSDQWILQALVRAWKFGEAELPETFSFKVSHVEGRQSLMGRLDWFDRTAFLRPEALNDLVMMADVRINDVFEVKLKDVNVHSGVILVEAIELVERGTTSAPPSSVLEPNTTPEVTV
ncbi:hypothetical protein PFICI_01441 [Pestalotiopsis fici W106-1]|uniref:RNB domain-containing protein n=1 Tax=Pestalotiopsis fici (strain W106-1 / CGMCC3.15140) TaxID=1229662 RepID=W3XNH9_PESFW|nr:uncharacterized protein PFICI_01441 [Pestalotiopsis fici W106-1]ETS87613.1 hypothetical protein PFICI_01441 [Pestalotiopsis fici W106-1]